VHFTSIKANIGHCEAASGAAALAKVILMMRHGKIPPQISLKMLNPRIKSLGFDGAVIDRNEAPWYQPGDQPRLALINNFGAAGSNAAMILQESNTSLAPDRVTRNNLQTYILGISAKSTKVLLKLKEALITRLTGAIPATSLSLDDICYTMTARRQPYDFRLSVTADSVHGLIKNLRSVEPSQTQGIRKTELNKVVFVFSGQGSQVT
jgi:acyl transferase domain-containing protein